MFLVIEMIFSQCSAAKWRKIQNKTVGNYFQSPVLQSLHLHKMKDGAESDVTVHGENYE